MSRIPLKHRIERTTTITPATSTTRSGTRVSVMSMRPPGRQLATVKPSDDGQSRPSLLQKRVFQQALTKSVAQPGNKVRATGVAKSQTVAPKIATKRGKEPLLQQMVTETTIQRSPKAEYIGKTLKGVDVAPSGVARQIEMTTQQIDPRHGTESAGVNETVQIKSTLSITTGGKQKKTSYKKKTLKSDKLAEQPNLNPHHISRLIIEEAEDVENTLRMVPPELVSTSVEKYPLKKKLQALRLHAEPVSILTQSVMYATPTADEMESEAPPEVLAEVIDAVEKGATPESAPNQIFNSLFPEVQERKIGVSSVAPGPLEDIVVPIAEPERLFEEVLTQEMEQFLAAEIQNKQELPKDDICTENKITAPESTTAGGETVPRMIESEVPPWEDATVHKLANLVGGDPLFELEAMDYSVLEAPENINEELSKGVDYFIDADVVPYENKIQIRGSKIPKWFPGYMSAFPHLPGIVKISRSPSEVLHAAWKAVQPKIFPEESLLIV